MLTEPVTEGVASERIRLVYIFVEKATSSSTREFTHWAVGSLWSLDGIGLRVRPSNGAASKFRCVLFFAVHIVSSSASA